MRSQGGSDYTDDNFKLISLKKQQQKTYKQTNKQTNKNNPQIKLNKTNKQTKYNFW